jgi:hypothetical protein
MSLQIAPLDKVYAPRKKEVGPTSKYVLLSSAIIKLYPNLDRPTQTNLLIFLNQISITIKGASFTATFLLWGCSWPNQRWKPVRLSVVGHCNPTHVLSLLVP